MKFKMVTIQYGSHSSIDVIFESHNPPDTEVKIGGVSFCWISWDKRDSFLNDLTNLLKKYYI